MLLLGINSRHSSKILPAAFQYLFHKLNDAFSQTDFFHGYRLLAVDGTDIHIPNIPDDYGTHYCANDISKGYNLMHLNALYDLLNRRYMDAVLQDSRSENDHSALIHMLENVKHSSIVIGVNIIILKYSKSIINIIVIKI